MCGFGNGRLFRLHRSGGGGLFGRRGGAVGGRLLGSFGGSGAAAENMAQLLSDVFVDGTRVSFLFGNAQLGKFVQQFVSFDFQLPGQHVNTNLVHK